MGRANYANMGIMYMKTTNNFTLTHTPSSQDSRQDREFHQAKTVIPIFRHSSTSMYCILNANRKQKKMGEEGLGMRAT